MTERQHWQPYPPHFDKEKFLMQGKYKNLEESLSDKVHNIENVGDIPEFKPLPSDDSLLSDKDKRALQERLSGMSSHQKLDMLSLFINNGIIAKDEASKLLDLIEGNEERRKNEMKVKPASELKPMSTAEKMEYLLDAVERCYITQEQFLEEYRKICKEQKKDEAIKNYRDARGPLPAPTNIPLRMNIMLTALGGDCFSATIVINGSIKHPYYRDLTTRPMNTNELIGFLSGELIDFADQCQELENDRQN